MDLILGRFADAEIADLTDIELAEFERLLEVPDPDLYAAVIGDRPAPGGLFAHRHRAVEHGKSPLRLRRDARSPLPTSQKAPKGSSSPISRARWRQNQSRRR